MKYCKDCKYHVVVKKWFGRTESYCNHIKSTTWDDKFGVTGNVKDRKLLGCHNMRSHYQCGIDAKLFEPLLKEQDGADN